MNLDQFPDPVREFRILLFQIQWVLIRLSLMELLVKTHFTEEDFTVWSLIVMSNHIGNDFQPYWSHSFPLFLYESIAKEWPEYKDDKSLGIYCFILSITTWSVLWWARNIETTLQGTQRLKGKFATSVEFWGVYLHKSAVWDDPEGQRLLVEIWLKKQPSHIHPTARTPVIQLSRIFSPAGQIFHYNGSNGCDSSFEGHSRLHILPSYRPSCNSDRQS